MTLAPFPPLSARDVPDGTPIAWYDHNTRERRPGVVADPSRYEDRLDVAVDGLWWSAALSELRIRLDHPAGEAFALRLILRSRGIADPGPAVLVCEGEPRRWHIRRFVHVEGRGTVVAACYRLAWDEACRGLGEGDRLEALRRILATVEAP